MLWLVLLLMFVVVFCLIVVLRIVIWLVCGSFLVVSVSWVRFLSRCWFVSFVKSWVLRLRLVCG